jgi:hypothetical protein
VIKALARWILHEEIEYRERQLEERFERMCKSVLKGSAYHIGYTPLERLSWRIKQLQAKLDSIKAVNVKVKRRAHVRGRH